jgi:hypothetical protein
LVVVSSGTKPAEQVETVRIAMRLLAVGGRCNTSVIFARERL